MRTRTHIRYSHAEPLIRSGDLLACRGRGFVSAVIQAAGRSEASHVELASWVGTNGGRKLEAVGFREFQGGRAVSFRRLVEDAAPRKPGGVPGARWDVYRPAERWSSLRMGADCRVEAVETPVRPLLAADWLRERTGHPYGWMNVRWAAFRHFPFLRWLMPIVADASAHDDYPPFCSQAVVAAYRETHRDAAGRVTVNPVRELPDWLVEPGDLVRSPFWSYLFTVVSDDEPADCGAGAPAQPDTESRKCQ